MKKIYILFFPVLFFCNRSSAQLSGVYTIPGSYSSLTAALADLNTQGVSAAVTINIAGGYTETAPAGEYMLGSAVLNASLSSTNTLTIQNAGGANPVFTANSGTSITIDAILTIAGCDYVTLNGLSFSDNAANNTPTLAMESGIRLVNRNAAAPFDGCSFNTIQNCNITLANAIATSSTPSRGIYALHTNAAGTAVTITATGDAHSNNKFYGNTIIGANFGIQLTGFAAASPFTLYDQNNDIGGIIGATGNTINNFGGTNLYTGVAGISATSQNNLRVGYNTLNQAASGGITPVGAIVGIIVSGTNSVFNINSNKITLNIASINTGYSIQGIVCTSAGTNFTANNNTIVNTELSGQAVINYGISVGGALSTITVMNSRITQTNNVGGTTGSTYGILSTATGAINLSVDTVTQVSTVSTNNQYYSLVFGGNSIVSETATNNVFMNSNVISGGVNGYMILLYTSNTTGNKSFSGNRVVGTITHTSTSTAGTTGILCVPSTAPAAGTALFGNNDFSNITSTGVPFIAIDYEPGVATSQNVIINNNNISNLTGTTGYLAGIITSSGNNISMSNNTIHDFNNGTADVYGIYNVGTNNVSETISKNKIYNLNSSTGFAGGINIQGGALNNVNNNLVGNLNSTAGTGNFNSVEGIALFSTQANSAINVYANTVYLNATSTGANFSTAGLFHTASATAATATLDLRDNIIVNNSSSSGTGFTTAFARSAAATGNYAATSNNNLFYAGTPSSVNLIYNDSTSMYSNLAAFQAAVAAKESASVTENPPFTSTTGSDPTFLHFASAAVTLAANGGSPIATVTTDYDGDARDASTPDIGADEFSFTVVAVRTNYFRGSKSGTANYLTWKINISGDPVAVSLERSADGINFKSIYNNSATVSSAINPFDYTDLTPFTGKNYYRLRMTELSGRVTYSSIVVLLNATKGTEIVSIAPTVNDGSFKLNITSVKAAPMTVIITDMNGRLVSKQSVTLNSGFTAVNMNMSELSSGTYRLYGITSEGKTEALGFIKK